MNFQPRFLFRGNAFGVGGQVREPYLRDFTVQAATSLPTVGGLSSSRASRTEWQGILSFDSARTQARGGIGGKDDQTTVVTSEVRGVDVEGRLRVGRMTMGLRSFERRSEAEPVIVPEFIEISGMSVDGCPVEVKLDAKPFIDGATRGRLHRRYKDPKWRKQYGGRFFRECQGENELREFKGLLFATVVESVAVHHDEDSCDRHRGKLVVKENSIVVPDFGTVYLGEIIISAYYRRLSAMRLELGSPVQGRMEFSGVESNGSGAP
jgi:hypothetical protein